MDLQTNIVHITGATGWLGRGLINALVYGIPECEKLRAPAASVHIRALVMKDDDVSDLEKLGSQIEIIRGDVRYAQDCDRFFSGGKDGLLFHTAGVIHPRRIKEFYEINVDGTINVLNAAIREGINRAVIVSSNSPCGCNPHNDHEFDETSPFNPYMNYGRSKMMMEIAVKDSADMIDTVIIRPPWFYGPYQPPRQALFFKMIRDGKVPIVGGGNNKRSMAFIDNLSQGLILAAISPSAKGQTYWIADQRPYSMNEIIDTIERLLETEFDQPCVGKRIRLPGFVSKLAELADRTLQSTGLYSQKIHVLSEMNKTIACSIDKATKSLGYRPTVSLEEGMRRSLQDAFDRGALKS